MSPGGEFQEIKCKNKDCAQKLSVPTTRGPGIVTCPRCEQSFDYIPPMGFELRRNGLLLDMLYCALYLPVRHPYSVEHSVCQALRALNVSWSHEQVAEHCKSFMTRMNRDSLRVLIGQVNQELKSGNAIKGKHKTYQMYVDHLLHSRGEYDPVQVQVLQQYKRSLESRMDGHVELGTKSKHEHILHVLWRKLRISRLVAKLCNPNVSTETRLRSARVLCRIIDPSVFEPLIVFMSAANDEIVTELCTSLSSCPLSAMHDMIDLMYKGRKVTHVTIPVRILAMTGDPRVIGFLLKALRDNRYPDIQPFIDKSLGSFGDAIISPIVKASRAEPFATRSIASPISHIDAPEALDSLLEILDDETLWRIHHHVIRALGNIKGSVAMQTLYSAFNRGQVRGTNIVEHPLGGETPFYERFELDLRPDVVRALHDIRETGAMEIRLKVLRDDAMDELHETVVHQLGLIGDPSTAQALVDRLEKSDRFMRALIFRCLISIQDRTTKPIAVAVEGLKLNIRQVISMARRPGIPFQDGVNRQCIHESDRENDAYITTFECRLKKTRYIYDPCYKNRPGEPQSLCLGCVDYEYRIL